MIFASYAGRDRINGTVRVLFKTRLIFSRINSPNVTVSVIVQFCWNSFDNSSVHSHLQSCKISSESNPQSTSAGKCASNGTIPRENVRYQCFVFLRNFCRMLSPAFLLCSIVNIRQRSNFFLVGLLRDSFFRSSQFVVKSCGLLLAISRNSSNYEKDSEKIYSASLRLKME